MKTRIYFLDNLRTFLIFLVVLLHAGIVYEPILENIWIVSDPTKNSSIGLVRMYLDIFVMFILFFISGYFIPVSLKSKNTRDFLKSKFKRIILPWIIAIFTLIPAYKAIFLFSRGLPQEEWFSYFHLFQRTGTDISFFANNPTQNWLWFLPVLFLFQVLYLALSKINLLSLKISLKTGVILTFIIGLIYSMIISGLDIRGWFHSALLHFQRERLPVYFMVFLLGSLCYKLNVFELIKKNRKFYILSNVVLTISLSIFTTVALNLFFNMIDPGRNYFFVSAIIDKSMYYSSLLLSMLSFLYIFIRLFRFSFNKRNIIMDNLNKNSYSVYIIHMVVMGIFALFLLNINIPAFIKYFLLTILTFVVSNFIVYAYRIIFKKILSKNILTIAIPFLAVFLTIIIYAKQQNSFRQKVQLMATQTKISPPAVGVHMAVIEGNLEAIVQHINAGSDLDVKEPSGGSSPLIMAALFGKTEIALVLIEAGADMNFKNNEGSTPLLTAAFFCRTEIVETLLNNGADKSIMNNAGSTALESVAGPFEDVKSIYEYFGATLGPLGLELDYDRIKKIRPKIVKMLQK